MTDAMWRLTKRFDFCASHQLLGLGTGHPCARLHGHNYSVTLHLRGEVVTSVGMLVDYRDLDDFKRLLDLRYDHQHLNDVVPCNPTAELLAQHFYQLVGGFPWGQFVDAVTVKETEKTSATYSRE